jgi:hypothetical protein
VRTGNIINEACARELVGKSFLGGTFVSYETRSGKTTLTAKCNQCGGPHSGISALNADQAVRFQSHIPCQHCKLVIESPKALTYEDILLVPERQRTSAQDRIVVEHDFAVRKAQQERVKQAPVLAARAEANRAVKGAMWDQRERFLTALAHIDNAQFVNDPRVTQHEDYQTWESWQELSDEQRAETNRWVDTYFANHDLRYGLREEAR